MAEVDSSRDPASRSGIGRPPAPHATDLHRSRIMRSVRQRRTTPEIAVSEAARTFGWRLRPNVRTLPGSPDLASKRHGIAIFVHGCFWHRHLNCRLASHPKHNRRFWADKFDANVRRDRRNRNSLERSGYSVLVVWECETRDPRRLANKLSAFARRVNPKIKRRS